MQSLAMFATELAHLNPRLTNNAALQFAAHLDAALAEDNDAEIDRLTREALTYGHN